MHDAIIIGKGPAGIQAAIYLARARIDVLVIDCGRSALNKAESVGNYFGLAHPLSGAKLLAAGDDQARALGINIADEQVVGLAYADGDGFAVITPKKRRETRALIIATGAARKTASIPGIAGFEGKGVSYCAACDGFFYSGKSVGVLGAAEYAMREASELEKAGASVTLFTNGERLGGGNSGSGNSGGGFDGSRFRVVREKVVEAVSARDISDANANANNGADANADSNVGANADSNAGASVGADRFGGLRTADGRLRPLAGLFVAVGIADSGALARILGVETSSDGSVATDRSQATNVPGVFAAGDCTGVFRQLAVAVGQGALAARGVIEYLERKK